MHYCEKAKHYPFPKGEHYAQILIFGRCWKCEKEINDHFKQEYPEFVAKCKITNEESLIPF